MSDKNTIPVSRIIGKFTAGNNIDTNLASRQTARILVRTKSGGRYILQRELARGGMGVIHSVKDQDLGRTSAMKVIGPNLIGEERKMAAFVREARITAMLEHPNIIPVHEIAMDEETGLPFYTMKQVEGESLNWIISRCAAGSRDYITKYNRHRLLDIFRKVCDAVSYAHSRNVIHRDIKPENVMVGQFGEVLLMDWGLAKMLGTKEETDSENRLHPRQRNADSLAMTQDGVIKGSLAYLSPEQAFGDLSEVDIQSDIFLLGATLYHMLTWFAPYDGKDLNELLDKAEKCDFLPPSTKSPQAQIPLALERIVLTAMAPVKANRYASVQDMINDLDAFVSGKRVCGRRIFSPGEELIQIGDTSRETYVIISGTVQVSRDISGHIHPLCVLGHGDIIGEMAGITHHVRSATVTAIETTEALVITHDLMLEELEKLPPWMEKIVFSMADRVRILDQNLNPLMLRHRGYPVAYQVYNIFLAAKNSDYAEHFVMTKARLADEIVVQIGVDRESVVKILNVLIEHRMLVPDGKQLKIPNLHDFGVFVDYCRHQFDVAGGVKNITKMEMSPAMNSYFRQVVRSIRALKMEQNPDEPDDDTTVDSRNEM